MSQGSAPSDACPVPRPLGEVFGSVLFITLLFLLSFLTRYILSPLLPYMREDLQFSPSVAGSMFFMASLGAFLGALFSGHLSSRIRHRGTLLVAVFLSAVALAGASLAREAWLVQTMIFVVGICAGLTLPSATATVAAMVTPDQWGKAHAVQLTGPRLAYAAAPLLSIGLLALVSWRGALLAVAGLTAASGIAFLLSKDLGRFPGAAPRLSTLASIMRQRSCWAMLACFSLGTAAQAGLYSMMPLYLTQERGFSPSTTNLLIGLASIGPVLAALGAGWLSDRLGEKHTLALVMVLTGAAAICVGSLGSRGAAASLFFLAALAGSFFPPAFAIVSRIVQPAQRSLASGLIPPAGLLVGGGAVPILLGKMGEVYTYGLGIVLTGAAVTAGSALVLAVRLLDELEEGC